MLLEELLLQVGLARTSRNADDAGGRHAIEHVVMDLGGRGTLEVEQAELRTVLEHLAVEVGDTHGNGHFLERGVLEGTDTYNCDTTQVDLGELAALEGIVANGVDGEGVS